MWLLLILALVVIFLIAKNKKKTDCSCQNTKKSSPGQTFTSISPDKPENPRQAQIDRDKKLAKNIFIYGGGACLVLLVAGIIFALNPSMSMSEKTGTLTDIGVPVVLVLGIIALGSLLSNKSKKTAHASSTESAQKDDGFYKPYFCDEYGHEHHPTDPDFMFELRRYSNRNMEYYNVALKEHELDWYIVDESGNTINIRNQSTITMRDHYNHYCRITLK